MTNRQRLLNSCEYDLLLNAQKVLDESGSSVCVLELLGMKRSEMISRCSGLCELCIQRWLNETEA